MLQGIKDWVLHKEFKANARPQGHKSSGINAMQSVCILFDGTEEATRKIVHKFKKSINPDGKRNIKSLAFIHNALPLDNIDYAAYNLKNLKWSGLPFGEKVDEFINFSFDALIVLCPYMAPHFEYIIAHAESKFIIGPSIPNAEKYFDLTVDIMDNAEIEDIIKFTITALNKVVVK